MCCPQFPGPGTQPKGSLGNSEGGGEGIAQSVLGAVKGMSKGEQALISLGGYGDKKLVSPGIWEDLTEPHLHSSAWRLELPSDRRVLSEDSLGAYAKYKS